MRRKKQTPWTVKLGDAVASRVIAIGGIGTIAAVMLVVLVLVATAWPLLHSSEIGQWRAVKLPTDAWRHFAVDEDGLLVWGVDSTGNVRAYSLVDQQLIAEFPHPDWRDDLRMTASCLSIDQRHVAVGFNDGSVQTLHVPIKSAIVPVQGLPSPDIEKSGGGTSSEQRTVYRRFDESSFTSVTLDEPRWSKRESIGSLAVNAIDYLPPEDANQFAQSAESKLSVATSAELAVATITQRKNMLSGAIVEELSTVRAVLTPRSRDARPLGMMLLNRGTQAVVVWPAGTLDRFNLEQANPRLVESTSGLPGGGEFTCTAPLLARQTLLCGDAAGNLSGWMVVRSQTPSDAPATLPTDGYQLAPAHSIKMSSQRLASIASSSRNHVALTLDASGKLALAYVTTDDLLADNTFSSASPLRQAVLTPKGDSLAVLAPGALVLASVNLAHPEASLKGLFGKTWYEGYEAPRYVWQSSAGTESAETKLSLIPLVFGTLKATIFAMMFSVPLAILAAIYTSEFFSPRARNRVKPLIEMMASLPSVVLGFIAALILAPLLQLYLCAVLLSGLLVPFGFLFAAHLWNLLPVDRLIRYQSMRLWLLLVAALVSVIAATTIAPLVEGWLFAGDAAQWLSARSGSAVGGWMLLLIPWLALVCAALCLGPLADYWRTLAGGTTPRKFAVLMFARLIGLSIATVLVAWGIGALLALFDLDARALLFGEYRERNALLVGAVLGFCVIPIIYTIADDALQAVPQQLRSASLGCGATPWQTTIRIVVPSAMSGLFSAVMIGLGRAVGETMVVLMAAGNTAVMEWNPFNGFRTLSATLATELPEAAKGSTHYRTLFLAALILFFLTLIINSIAEFVRIRFRRRASQL